MRVELRPRNRQPGEPFWKDWTEHEFEVAVELARRWDRLETNVREAEARVDNPPNSLAMRHAQHDLIHVVKPAMQVCETRGTTQYGRFIKYVELRGPRE